MANKTCRPFVDNEFEQVIDLLKNGYVGKDGVVHRGNEMVALAIWLEGVVGIRVSDIVRVRPSSFVRQNSNDWYIQIVEKKTKKKRNFYVTDEIKDSIFNYCLDHNIGRNEPIIKCTTRNIQKHLKNACDYLGLEGCGTHSSRKKFSNAIFSQKNDLYLLSTILNHSSVETTKRYISINTNDIKEALSINSCSF
jgi:integrase